MKKKIKESQYERKMKEKDEKEMGLLRNRLEEARAQSHTKKLEHYESSWTTIAWVNKLPSGNFKVLDAEDHSLIGLIWGKILRRLVVGEIKGCPIVARTKDLEEEKKKHKGEEDEK